MTIEEKIKETEKNIKSWYRQSNETEVESQYWLRKEKLYLSKLKESLKVSRKNRIEDNE